MITLSLVVVHDLDVGRASRCPAEAQAELVAKAAVSASRNDTIIPYSNAPRDYRKRDRRVDTTCGAAAQHLSPTITIRAPLPLPSSLFPPPYSTRSAAMGSIRVARWAGSQQARRATAANSAVIDA